MLEKIKEILVEQLNCDADSINEDTSFKDDLGADSLDLYEMVMALEDEYGIEIDTDELTDLSTVGDFMEYLARFLYCCCLATCCTVCLWLHRMRRTRMEC